jgi:hypothetical protein
LGSKLSRLVLVLFLGAEIALAPMEVIAKEIEKKKQGNPVISVKGYSHKNGKAVKPHLRNKHGRNS